MVAFFTTTAMTDLIQKPSSGISPSSTPCHTQIKQTNIGQWKSFEINKRCNQNNIYICICYDHVFPNLGILVNDADIQFLHFAQHNTSNNECYRLETGLQLLLYLYLILVFSPTLMGTFPSANIDMISASVW